MNYYSLLSRWSNTFHHLIKEELSYKFLVTDIENQFLNFDNKAISASQCSSNMNNLLLGIGLATFSVLLCIAEARDPWAACKLPNGTMLPYSTSTEYRGMVVICSCCGDDETNILLPRCKRLNFLIIRISVCNSRTRFWASERFGKFFQQSNTESHRQILQKTLIGQSLPTNCHYLHH